MMVELYNALVQEIFTRRCLLAVTYKSHQLKRKTTPCVGYCLMDNNVRGVGVTMAMVNKPSYQVKGLDCIGAHTIILYLLPVVSLAPCITVA